jgi:hypothetical protein
MTAVTLPTLEFAFTEACSSRHGTPVRLIWLHTWGTPGGVIDGVKNFFMNPAHDVSAHFVYAGEKGKDKGRCIQMVHMADKAWTEAAYNSSGISIECADPIWQGKDPAGLARVARITGWLLKRYQLPAQYVDHNHISSGRGFTRHADGGLAGGGHTSCPTTNMALWHSFVQMVQHEVAKGGYRTNWAK